MVELIKISKDPKEWPEGIQEEVELMAELDGDPNSISDEDIQLSNSAFCSSTLKNSLIGKAVCRDSTGAWSTQNIWTTANAIESLQSEYSLANKVHWHLDKEGALLGKEKREKAYEILREIKEKFKIELAKRPNISDREKTHLVYNVLGDMGFVLKEQRGDPSFINNLIRGKIDCDTSSFILRALGEEFGWPIHLIYIPPEHLMTRWGKGKESFNIDWDYSFPDILYLAAGNLDGELDDYEISYEASVHATCGEIKLGRVDVEGAIAEFDAAIRLAPKYIRAYNNRGVAKKFKGDYGGALEDFNEAIRLGSGSPKMFNNRAMAYAVMGDYKSAIADYDEAISLGMKDAEIFADRGIARFRNGDSNGAIADFNEAIRLMPDISNTYLRRAIERLSKKDAEGALLDFDTVIRLAPNNAVAYLGRGNIKQYKGDLDGAIADFSEAIRLDPELALAYRDRAVARYLKGDTDRALDDFDDAKRLDPSITLPK